MHTWLKEYNMESQQSRIWTASVSHLLSFLHPIWFSAFFLFKMISLFLCVPRAWKIPKFISSSNPFSKMIDHISGPNQIPRHKNLMNLFWVSIHWLTKLAKQEKPNVTSLIVGEFYLYWMGQCPSTTFYICWERISTTKVELNVAVKNVCWWQS